MVDHIDYDGDDPVDYFRNGNSQSIYFDRDESGPVDCLRNGNPLEIYVDHERGVVVGCWMKSVYFDSWTRLTLNSKYLSLHPSSFSTFAPDSDCFSMCSPFWYGVRKNTFAKPSVHLTSMQI